MLHYFVALDGIDPPLQSDVYTDVAKRNADAQVQFEEMYAKWDVVIVLCVDVNEQGEIFTAALQSYKA